MFNHSGKEKEGLLFTMEKLEAFIQFAKKEGVSEFKVGEIEVKFAPIAFMNFANDLVSNDNPGNQSDNLKEPNEGFEFDLE